MCAWLWRPVKYRYKNLVIRYQLHPMQKNEQILNTIQIQTLVYEDEIEQVYGDTT